MASIRCIFAVALVLLCTATASVTAEKRGDDALAIAGDGAQLATIGSTEVLAAISNRKLLKHGHSGKRVAKKGAKKAAKKAKKAAKKLKKLLKKASKAKAKAIKKGGKGSGHGGEQENENEPPENENENEPPAPPAEEVPVVVGVTERKKTG